MNGAPNIDRIRLFLLAVMCWLCFTPAAHAMRPPSPAELQLKEKTPCQEQPAYDVVWTVDAEVRTGLFVLNNPLRYTDPSGHDFVATAADLRYGYIPGPNIYKTGNSTIGQIGASVYNVAPLIANATFQGMRGLAAADRAAGDVLATGTFALTRDPQLAENSRNLTLLVGGVGELGKVAKVDEAVSSAIVKYDAKFALQQGANPAKVVPDPYAVVRGGQAPMPAAGTTFSGSMGATVPEAAAGVPHGTIRSTTAGAVREQGGSVVLAPEGKPLNLQHVNVQEGGGGTTFSAPMNNPVPKGQRWQKAD